MCRGACKSSTLSQLQPSTTLLQRREFASHGDIIYKQTSYEKVENVNDRKYGHSGIGGKVFIVIGGGQGLGFSIAEGLFESGGIVHAPDRSSKPTPEFEEAGKRVKDDFDGALEYHHADVADEEVIGKVISEIAAREQRLNGLLAGL